jgi:hypothetical protein
MSVDDWARFDEAHGAPTFFARPAWAGALAATMPEYRPSPLSIELSDGSRVIVPMLASKTRVFGLRMLTGMPYRTYTAFLGEDGRAASQEATDAAARYILDRCADGVEIVPWPMGSLPRSLDADAPMPTASVIDLRTGIDACLAKMEGTARRMARQAERRGVTCELDASSDAVATHFQMLVESAQRWKRDRPSVPLSLLTETIGRGAEHAEVWVARYDGAAIAGGTVLYGSSEAYFWTAAMRSDYGPLRPHNLLNVRLMERACARGCDYLNLGESEGLPGVRRFKESLGAMAVTYPVLQSESLRLRVYRSLGDVARRRSARARAHGVGESSGRGDFLSSGFGADPNVSAAPE